ncbi:CHC2 zinc finger domain-containing protein [Limnobaculum parvum]|uniref:DNA primase n=1 Tax=Limnobaculum parvum TaxID=2172103 RepID=A0A2Y9TW26_9GAMM|nr:CHC2 zinc finger domain-containing protein [Limnobaculum parvum]AWH87799.1 DNA primase [Limnobaculum parvum]AWH87806.1 DNA primase [Limnobaculum parvum]
MPRIPEHEINELKQSLSLLSVAESQGHKFKKRGQDSYTCLCPFHQEKTPSLVVTPSKNLFHCFGCGASGSALDWLMKTEHLTFLNGLVRLRELGKSAGLLSQPVLSEQEASTVSRTKLIDLNDDGQALLNQVVDFYHQKLLESPEAQEWLIRRGLNHPELISHFRLGYAGLQGVTEVLPSRLSHKGKAQRDRLVELGVLRQLTRHDHFKAAVVIPVVGWSESANVAHRGRVLQLYGRKTQADYKETKGNPRHLYLSSPLAGVWNEAAMQASTDIILCEALIDAMTFWCAGFRNVIAAYGCNGFTADHLVALQHHGVKRVFIAYDRDEAGDKGAESVAAELLEVGIEAWRVRFSLGMDANEFAVKSGAPEKALGLVLQQAAWMGHSTGPMAVLQTTPNNDERQEEKPSSLAAPASPATQSVEEIIPCEQTATGELLLRCGPRVWRVRGWQKNTVAEVMKVSIQVRDETSGVFHVDTLDMYSSRHRQGYINTAAEELECEPSVIKRECGRVLLMLEQKQDEQREAQQAREVVAITMSAEDEAAALELLKSPDLAERVVNDLASCGVVGESSNLLTGYLAATSRKLDKPLAVLIQSSSAAGKSSLMDAVLGLMPEEERIQYSAMTGQSLYYLGETSLQHKILAIAEEEGVRQAAYALKLLQSDGELKIASTGKNEQSGELVTREYKVQGPVMLMLTTTAIDVDEELLNRCLVLTVNESREQTQAIHALQRHNQTLEGLLAESEKGWLTKLHQNAQRLLRPLKVVNPFAHQLTFLSDKTRTRRDHMKYLTLIQSIALLHQYQRKVKRVEHRGQWLDYIEVEKSDIELANKLAHEVLGRTLDEMPPQTRRLLVLLKGWVGETAVHQALKAEEVRFSRRDVRAALGWGDTQLKIHLARLLEMEYLLLYRRGLTYEYTLLWDGEDNNGTHLCGLLDTGNDNRSGCEPDRSNVGGTQSASGRHVVGGQSESEKGASGQAAQGLKGKAVGSGKKRIIKEKKGMSQSVEPAINQKVTGRKSRSGSESDRSVSDEAQSVQGRGVVGGQSEGDKGASGQMAQGVEAKVVGSEQNTVIRKKKKSASSAVVNDREVTHG